MQLSNTKFPIVSTLAGIVIASRFLQSLNVVLFMVVRVGLLSTESHTFAPFSGIALIIEARAVRLFADAPLKVK